MRLQSIRCHPVSRSILLGLTSGSLLVLTACSSVKLPEGKISYKTADTTPSLELPPDLSSPEFDHTYSSPLGGKVTASSLAKRSVELGGKLKVLPTTKGIKIVREGNTRWLEVALKAESLWPKLRDFWREFGLSLKRDEPTLGIMETEWAENRAEIPQGFIHKNLGKLLGGLYDAGSRDRFRMRVEKISANKTQVFVSHSRAEEQVTDNGVKWGYSPANPEFEVEVLNRLIAFLRGDRGTGAQSVESVETILQTNLVVEEGRTRLVVKEKFSKIWSRAGVMIERAGMKVEDQNRREGIYYVVYDGNQRQKDKEGWFSNFFKSPTKVLKVGTQYQVHLAESAGQTVVTISDEDGHPVHEELSQLFLDRLNSEFLR